MIKYKLSKNADILFVGINPHHSSYKRGVPFSNNKMFWYLLNRAGIIDEDIDDLKNDASLKKIYENKFQKKYNLNLINIIARPSRDVSTLKRGEENDGRNLILGTILKRRPYVVCFIGRVTYQKFIGNDDFKFGWQDDIADSKIFVMHFPIRGKAEVRVKELKEVHRTALGSHGVIPIG